MKKIFRRIGIAAAVLIGLPVLLLVVVLIALTIPSVQQKAVSVAAGVLSEKTGMEVSVGRIMTSMTRYSGLILIWVALI